MKKFIILPLIGLIAGNISANPISPLSQKQQQDENSFVPGQIIVHYKKGLSESQKNQLVEPVAVQIKHLGKRRSSKRSKKTTQKPSVVDDLSVLTLKKNMNIQDAIEDCERNPNILYAEPNYIYKAIQTIPNDTDFDLLWGMHNTGQTGGTPDIDINAPEAWDITTGTKDVVVAVIDTGVDYNHPDLVDNLWINQLERDGVTGEDDDGNGFVDDIYGYDFKFGDSDPYDDGDHGTHVSGTIGALANNSQGVAGVAWNVKMMAVKFLGGPQGSGTTEGAIEAIRYAMENGAHIMNNSWGGGPRSQSLQNIINEAHDAGILFIAAAGNDSSGALYYPATYDNVFTVGAIDHDGRRSIWSERSGSNFGEHVDVSGPGTGIYSTIVRNRYDSFNGTSMATPHVAGVAALVLSKNPGFTNEEVARVLRSSVKPLETDQYIGTGLIDAFQAVQVTIPTPIALLDDPLEPLFNENNRFLTLTGTAGGPDFASYSIEYGFGITPVEWTVLKQDSQPVQEGILLDRFDTSDLDDNVYTIRVAVRNGEGRMSQDRVRIKVEFLTAELDIPSQHFNFTPNVDIEGTAKGLFFSNYSLEHSAGSHTGPWVEVFQSDTPVDHGVLMTDFDVSLLPEGENSIRLLVRDQRGQVKIAQENILVDQIRARLNLSDTTLYQPDTHDLQGSASGAFFKDYRLDYGVGTNPSEWVEIRSSNIPIQSGILKEGFDTSQLSEGEYTLRLTVNDHLGRSEEDTVVFQVIVIEAELLGNALFSRGEPANILGSARAVHFQDYSIEFGEIEIFRSNNPSNDGILVENFDFSDLDDGDYSLRLTVRDTKGRIAEDSQRVRVDTPPPIARLRMPEFLVQGRVVPLQGTATGTQFTHYNLMLRMSGSNDWITFHESTMPVDDGLLAEFDPTPFEEGQYQFKLTVGNDLGDEAVDLAWATIGGAAIVSPQNNDVLRKGDSIPIEVVIGSPYQELRLDYGLGKNPDQWFESAIVGQYPEPGDSFQGTIAMWDTGRVEADSTEPYADFYRLRLTIQTSEETKYVYSNMIHLDAKLKPNWPVYLDFQLFDPNIVAGTSEGENLVADLDRDGQNEIIVMTREFGSAYVEQPSQLSVFNSEGTLLWSQRFTGRTTTFPIPTIGDFDGDGFDEIIVSEPDPIEERVDRLQVLNHDGTLMGSPWPIKISGMDLSTVLADLNGDGQLELIVKNLVPKDGIEGEVTHIHIINSAGTISSVIDIPYGADLFPLGRPDFPAVGNFDEDPDLEIVSRYDSTQLAIFNQDGSILPGWPKDLENSLVFSSPQVGDLDGNGEEDVFIAVNGIFSLFSGIVRPVSLFAFDRTGSLLPGWQNIEPSVIGPGDLTSWTSPALADFDNDGDLEIALSGTRPYLGYHRIFIYDHEGRVLPGWPQRTFSSSSAEGRGTLTIADMDGDSQSDLILPSGSIGPQLFLFDDPHYLGGVFSFRHDGSPIDLNPSSDVNNQIFYEFQQTRRFIPTDLDGDGRLDLIGGSINNINMRPTESLDGIELTENKNRGTLYAWDLGVPFRQNKAQWVTIQGNNQHTGRYQRPPKPDVLVVSAGDDRKIRLKKVGDGFVDGNDFLVLQVHFNARRGDPDYYPPADMNEDGIIDAADFGMWSQYFGTKNRKADINYPSLVQLEGSVLLNDSSDLPSDLQTRWDLTSGPAPAVFLNSTRVDSRVVFTDPGTYFLNLTASYNGIEETDQVIVDVNPILRRRPGRGRRNPRRPLDRDNRDIVVHANNGQYQISFGVTAPSAVTARLYNQRGRKSKTLFTEFLKAGSYTRNFTHQTKNLPPGLYHLVLKIGESVHKLKVVILN